MRFPVMLMLLAPVAGAFLAVSFSDVPRQRRAIVGVCSAAALAGAAAAIVRAAGGDLSAWRGFSADSWRGMLAAGALLATAVAVARADAGARGPAAQTALFAAGGGSVAALLAGGTHTVAVTLPLATLGLVVAGALLAPDGVPGLRWRRAVAALAVSDLVAIVALGLETSKAVALPPEAPSAVAGALLLASGAVRLGLLPFAWAAEDAARAHPSLGLLWLGPVRAQGILLIVWSFAGGGGIARAAAGLAVVTAVACALRAALERDPIPLAAAGAGIAVLGFALGGVVALWGGILSLAATFLAWPLWYGGGAWSDAARPTLGALPVGGALAGALLVAGGALEAGVARPGFLALAIPAVAALGALALAAATAPEARAGGDRAAAATWAGVGLAAALALAAVPARATSGLAFPTAGALGRGRLLSVGAEAGVAEGLAAVAFAVGLIAFAAGPGRGGTGGAPGRRTEPPAWWRRLAWWAAPGGTPAEGSAAAAARADRISRVWLLAAGALAAGAVGVVVRVFLAAAGRGFL